jgi:hypothetical protein
MHAACVSAKSFPSTFLPHSKHFLLLILRVMKILWIITLSIAHHNFITIVLAEKKKINNKKVGLCWPLRVLILSFKMKKYSKEWINFFHLIGVEIIKVVTLLNSMRRQHSFFLSIAKFFLSPRRWQKGNKIVLWQCKDVILLSEFLLTHSPTRSFYFSDRNMFHLA